MTARSTTLILATILFSACGGDGPPRMTTPPPPKPKPIPGAPMKLASMEGDNQTGTVAKQLPLELVAIVQDAAGTPVANAVVSWVGDGEVFSPATGTNAAGETRNEWILGTAAGEHTMQARWIDPNTGAARVLGAFTATAEADQAMTFTVTQTKIDTYVGMSVAIEPLIGEPQDQYGNEADAASVHATIDGTTYPANSTITFGEEQTTHIVLATPAMSDSVRTEVVHDLMSFTWSASARCYGPTNGIEKDDGTAMSVDSLITELPAGTFTYGTDRSFAIRGMNQTRIFWEDATTTERNVEGVLSGTQRPGRLHVAGETLNLDPAAPAPIAYSGRYGACWPHVYTGGSILELQAN